MKKILVVMPHRYNRERITAYNLSNLAEEKHGLRDLPVA